MLSDIQLGQGHREAVEENTQRAGGTVVKAKGDVNLFSLL
jgi:hypothetical protein